MWCKGVARPTVPSTRNPSRILPLVLRDLHDRVDKLAFKRARPGTREMVWPLTALAGLAGPRFKTQHPQSGSRPFITPVPRDPSPVLGSVGMLHM